MDFLMSNERNQSRSLLHVNQNFIDSLDDLFSVKHTQRKKKIKTRSRILVFMTRSSRHQIRSLIKHFNAMII